MIKPLLTESEALALLKEIPKAGFTEHDFGIPQIKTLIEKFENEEEFE